MRNTALKCALIGAMVGLSMGPVAAKPSGDDIAGALLLLGIAELAHGAHNYPKGWEPKGAKETADFERGYRDGNHNAEYDARQSDRAYGEGYSAGMKDRDHVLAHRKNAEGGEKGVPAAALTGCAKAVAGNYGIGTHKVHVVKSVRRGANDFLVETAVGHDHMSCVMGNNGTVVEVYGDRIK
jgi:hypothetical protein